MQIIVNVKTVYGEDKIYPACGKAQVFAQMLRQKTLTWGNIKHIRALGYEVKQVTKKLFEGV